MQPRLIRALLRQPVDYTPVWIMRQAGRYLPEYCVLRQKVGDFLVLCKTPELACEVTLQPLRRYPLDAAIIFSDILTIPDAMGLGLQFIKGVGPCFQSPIRSLAAIKALSVPDPMLELGYVCEAIRLCRRELQGKVPLIGFAGSPWTLACYMVEGQSSREFRRIKTLLYQEPKALHHLLQLLANSVTVYLNAQIQAGAQVVMLFDSWGGLLSSAAYKVYSLAYISQVIDNVIRQYEQQPIPIIVFTKGGSLWLEAIAQSGCDAVGLDWTIDIAQARQRLQDRVALQGNLDPAVLYADAERIKAEVKMILAGYGSGSGHVFNLGHGITPHTPPEHVAVLVEAVHSFSPAYHLRS